MPRPGDRRPLLADHAIAVLATGGARALSHRAVDQAADLAFGSTSYYFRSRRELIVATISQIREHSRAEFDRIAPPAELTLPAAAQLMANHLFRFANHRHHDALAVFALLPEVEDDAELRAQLTSCLFSHELATQLLTTLRAQEPSARALDMIDFLTGLLFGMLFGQRRAAGTTETSIVDSLQRFLESCINSASRS